MTQRMTTDRRFATLLALGAIGLWSLLAALAVGLRDVPPFLLLGLSLTGAGLLAAPTWRQWRVPLATLLLGLYGLFGYHLLLFLALRNAPAVEANLINYLWPLLIVVLSPLFVRGLRLTLRHLAAALLGMAGAALVITGGRWTLDSEHWPGYLLAAGAALAWATYSLGTRRVPPFPTAAVGLFCLVSGLLALASHALLEPRYAPSATQWGLIALLALGPMGAAFFLWDAALKRGDARTIGALSYLTPLLSTAMLVASGQSDFTSIAATAALLIVLGAVLGSGGGRESSSDDHTDRSD
ncbi:MAG: DMT family transporter [Betaproteobacteria bacterium]